MNNKFIKWLTNFSTSIIFAFVLMGFAQAAESKNKEAEEIQLFSQATISLQDAIKAAERKVGGQAMEAEINDETATVQFEVEILKAGQIHEVMVDGKTGNVLNVSLEDESKDIETNEGAENEKE